MSGEIISGEESDAVMTQPGSSGSLLELGKSDRRHFLVYKLIACLHISLGAIIDEDAIVWDDQTSWDDGLGWV